MRHGVLGHGIDALGKKFGAVGADFEARRMQRAQERFEHGVGALVGARQLQRRAKPHAEEGRRDAAGEQNEARKKRRNGIGKAPARMVEVAHKRKEPCKKLRVDCQEVGKSEGICGGWMWRTGSRGFGSLSRLS